MLHRGDGSDAYEWFMTKWFVLAVAMMLVAGVQSAEKKADAGAGLTKEKFIANQKKRMEAAGKEFDAGKAAANFTKKDKNGDGVLSKEEMAAGAKEKKKPAAE